MKRTGLSMTLIAGTALTVLAGCNTVEGVGRDLERAGDAIQDEAEDTRDDRRRDD
jgi:predicted small secreted protein